MAKSFKITVDGTRQYYSRRYAWKFVRLVIYVIMLTNDNKAIYVHVQADMWPTLFTASSHPGGKRARDRERVHEKWVCNSCGEKESQPAAVATTIFSKKCRLSVCFVGGRASPAEPLKRMDPGFCCCSCCWFLSAPERKIIQAEADSVMCSARTHTHLTLVIWADIEAHGAFLLCAQSDESHLHAYFQR